MIVTFDFDDTLKTALNNPNKMIVHRFKQHMKSGDDIYIVTSRRFSSDSLDEIENFLSKYDLEAIDIIHTNGDSKLPHLKKLGSELHYDDDPEDLKDAKKAGIDAIDAFNDQARKDWNTYVSTL